MSHHSTPHLHNKRTPGGMAADTSGQNLAGIDLDHRAMGSAVMDASRSVTDSSATNAKQLLNAYIYDFLLKNTLPQTAKCFVSEADVPTVASDLSHSSTKTSPHLMSNLALLDKDSALASTTPQTPAMAASQISEEHNLPNILLLMNAPLGFLYEWWLVFWDVFQAKSDNMASPLALQYYHMQFMKQKQQHELQGLDWQQNLGQAPAGNQMMGHPHMGMSGQPPGLAIGLGPNLGQMPMMGQPQGPMPMQQQFLRQQFPLLDPRQQRYMMQMMMKQQQQQQLQQQQQQQQQLQQPQQQLNQQQPLQPNQQPPPQPNQQQQQQQLQQQPQPQQAGQMNPGMDLTLTNMGMNMNMQQQMFMQQQQQQQQQQQRIQQQAQTQMNNLRQQAAARQQGGPAAAAAAAVAVAAAAASQPQAREGGSPVNMAGPQGARMGHQQGQQARQGRPGQPVMGNMQPYPQQVNGQSMSPQPFPSQPPNNSMVPAGANGGPNAPMMQNVNQNRNTNALQDYQMQLMLLEKQNKKRLDIARGNGAADLNLSMQLAPQQQQMQIKQQHPPKASPAPSPVQNNKPSPVTTAAKAKKATAAKRSRKPSAAANSTPSSAADNGRPGTAKKEYSTPLTPAAETDNKKKRKGSGGDSPKKQSKTSAAKKEKATPKPKKEEPKPTHEVAEVEEEKLDFDGKMAPPSSAGFFPGTLGGNDKMMSVDILGGDSTDGNFFSSNNGIDEFDFSFFEGNDGGLSDSITAFSWNNPIEGADRSG